MELWLYRNAPTAASIIGQLYLDDQFECYTLEDAAGIPAGRYELDITYSPRFATMLPILKNVPGRSGIRIHAGNTDKDTEGCILVGQSRGESTIGQSRLALDQLLKKLSRRVPVWITIFDLQGDADVRSTLVPAIAPDLPRP